MSEDTNVPRDIAAISPAFAQAMAEVYGEELNNPEPQAGEEGGASGAGTTPDPTAVEPGGQAPAAPDGGGSEPPAAVPNAGELPGVQADPAGAAAPGTEAGAGTGEPGAGEAGAGAADRPDARDFREISPELDTALTRINERAEQQFRAKATGDIQSQINPQLLEFIASPARLLVGVTVPDLKTETGTEILKDPQDAADWIATAKHILDGQIANRTKEYMNDAKPFLSTVQASIEMFRNNPELHPKAKEYNPELAEKFIKLAKSYEYRIDGKLIGYRVEVQPLLDNLKEQIAASPTAPAAPAAPAVEQPRAANGQFEAPQAGIPSQAGHSGTSVDDDYSAFWETLGMKEMNI